MLDIHRSAEVFIHIYRELFKQLSLKMEEDVKKKFKISKTTFFY
jgi:hypothetical protein